MAETRAVSTRTLIRTVAARWRQQYSLGTEDRFERTYKRLCALDFETATAADVRAIIGNDSWTTMRCDGCDFTVNLAVSVGAEPDYESSTALLCESCLRRALAALEALRASETGRDG